MLGGRWVMRRAIIYTMAVWLGGAVSAAEAADPYWSLFAVSHDLDDADYGTGLGRVSTSFDRDVGFGGALGFRFDPTANMRAEVEWADRSNDVSGHRLAGGPVLTGSRGSVSTQSLIFNVYYDFQVEPAFSPYVGAGLGLAKIDFEEFGSPGFPVILDDSDTVLVGQLMAGAWMRVTNYLHLFGDVRLFRADGARVTTAATAGSVETEIDHEAASIVVGARYEF